MPNTGKTSTASERPIWRSYSPRTQANSNIKYIWWGKSWKRLINRKNNCAWVTTAGKDYITPGPSQTWRIFNLRPQRSYLRSSKIVVWLIPWLKIKKWSKRLKVWTYQESHLISLVVWTMIWFNIKVWTSIYGERARIEGYENWNENI